MSKLHHPVPDVLSLVVCDQIITDRMTGKQSLIGMFSTIHAFNFPAVHGQLCVFCSLTDGHGETPLTIRFVDSNEARPPLVEGNGKVIFKNPRSIANLTLQFHGLRFPAPGEYRVQIWCGSELLREARLTLVQARQQPGAPPPQGGPPPGEGDPEPDGPEEG
ncbi:MAG: hypothetical protein KJ057_14980 [Phycisphaerae bacterium]|nr:MAG: hypothetical protein EDS66_09665 [Planctomycetota bacterium]KAB2949176.1 MAG: hypothetical protein F9K17_03825 [Phycisphaerae bacterium]MBE7458692.1 hypothetical protein [Planctomycetia bacterium]MCK6466014.1 hypothetical protein [Phycisphaerae bacterium]MCL4719772.1 hypothetical protein [Phycisphaerae bacterium]